MEEKIQDAVNYANGSNNLENNSLTVDELDQIIKDIQEGKTDESFLYSVVQLIKKYEDEVDEEEISVKNRR